MPTSVQTILSSSLPMGYTGSKGNVSHVEDTPPGSPEPGDTWYNSSEGVRYVYYSDGTSSQWVQETTMGPIGPMGYTGSRGYTGSQGAPGEAAAIGYTGSKGDIGYTGSQGIPGEYAAVGYTGSRGDVGYTGSVGGLGYTGSIGGLGYTGSIGYTGSQGTTGYTGSRGLSNIPISGGTEKTSPYTLVAGDSGTMIVIGTGGSVTIPNSTFTQNDVITIFNNTTATANVICNPTTVHVAGIDTNRSGNTLTISSRGVCSALFISSTQCVLTGNII